ncbi:MAG: class I SAM-dependent methyltransferase [Luminiphilus sp.]|nr:class I SAM-dependent methyltransferase [Luminiphilus sp.]
MDVWSRFWRQGHSTTFGDYFEQGYAGPVKAWLDSLPAQFPTISGRLSALELCCGNASLLPFLFSLGKDFDYVGIDAATVELPKMLEEIAGKSASTVNLLSNTPVETLPEAVQDIDVCLSAYGMEYSRLEDTLLGLHGRMSAGGKLFALMHHQQSVVAQMSQRAVDEYHEKDIALIQSALLTIHQTLVDKGNVAALKADAEAEQARKFMNGMGNKYVHGATLETGNAFMADHVLAALRFFKLLGQPADMRARFVSELAEEASAARERHQQMLSVASNAADMDTLTRHMTTIGWTDPQFNALTNKDGIIGWILTATV